MNSISPKLKAKDYKSEVKTMWSVRSDGATCGEFPIMTNASKPEARKEMVLFLAHAVELQEEARQRYEEMADTMASHHNTEVAQFFQRMAQESAQHSAEVVALAWGLALPELTPSEFDWLGTEPPETASFEAVRYRMSLRDAMALVLDNAQAARSVDLNLREVRRKAEVAAVRRAIANASGNISKSAKLLGITRPTLYDLMDRYDIPKYRIK
jgi:transcriptional regulator of acetoin/glycerol metabolism